MVEIKDNVSVKSFNSFSVDAEAKYFAKIHTEKELLELLKDDKYSGINKLILGGGSNVLFLDDFNGLIIYNRIKGIDEEEISEDEVLLKIGAGENWDEVVQYAVENNYGGIENLSLIPGSVGAAPVQNIGAYGVELESVFHSLEGYFIQNAEKKIFTKDECKFGYRNSIFKNELKNKFVISRVNLILQKNPKVNLSYASLKSVFEDDIDNIKIGDVRNKVIEIRQSKLPDPNELSNVGSFFKNPEINGEQLKTLLKKYPDTIYFQLTGDKYKIAAGWLIEKCGLKGFRKGNVGTHEKQALVIVNYGAVSGQEILNFAKYIQAKVLENFGILLEPEVNIINQ